MLPDVTMDFKYISEFYDEKGEPAPTKRWKVGAGCLLLAGGWLTGIFNTAFNQIAGFGAGQNLEPVWQWSDVRANIFPFIVP
jgi:hypothetical protein